VTEPNAVPPPAGEVATWVGLEVDEVSGGRVGRAAGVFLDAESGVPAWLVVGLERRGFLGRRRRGPAVAVPVRECAAAAGRVWTALDGVKLRSAPVVDPARPLLGQHEVTICGHYGIGQADGRHAEIASRPQGTVTAGPPN
jgi:hypothetical protein